MPTPTSELHDLGRHRLEHDTARATDRDYALHSARPVTVHQPAAAREHAAQVHAWNTLAFTTDERDEREEKKGGLHDGGLWRANKAAAMAAGAGYDGGIGMGGRERCGGTQKLDAICAGRKNEGGGPPLAKGVAEEMDKEMFWEEKIC